jgi:hypothetical protein
MAAHRPLRVSFDTNAYSVVVRPQIIRVFTRGLKWTAGQRRSKKERVVWLYLQWCVRQGRIIAGIPEAAFQAEVLPHVDRIAFLLKIGTPAAAALPQIPAGRVALIRKAFKLGFRLLRGGRIAYGAVFDVAADDWAADDLHDAAERQKRQSDFIKHFSDYSYQSVKALGNQLLALHGAKTSRDDWRTGFALEAASPKQFASPKAFQDALRHEMADWADFDMVAAHYAYGYDLLCTEDQGKPRSNSIFSPAYSSDMANIFQVEVVNRMELGQRCWQRFGLPIRKWG